MRYMTKQEKREIIEKLTGLDNFLRMISQFRHGRH